jgi:uncharacterized protein HemY
MARMILVWFILTVAIGAGIAAWRQLSGKEQWQLTKYIAYATMCSLVAVVALAFLVLMF